MRHMCLWATLCKVVHAQMIIADDASTNDRKASATADVKRFISKGITPGTSPYSVSVLEEDWLVEHISGVGAVTLTGKRTSCGQHPLTRNRTWMILRRGEARHICFGPGDPITTEHEARNVAIETLHATDWLGSTTLLEWIKNLGPSVISMSGHSQGGVVAATLASDPLLGNLLPCCTSVVGTGPRLLLKASGLCLYSLFNDTDNTADPSVPQPSHKHGESWMHNFSMYRYVYLRDVGATPPCEDWMIEYGALCNVRIV